MTPTQTLDRSHHSHDVSKRTNILDRSGGRTINKSIAIHAAAQLAFIKPVARKLPNLFDVPLLVTLFAIALVAGVLGVAAYLQKGSAPQETVKPAASAPSDTGARARAERSRGAAF
jgi:hypothetical protein